MPELLKMWVTSPEFWVALSLLAVFLPLNHIAVRQERERKRAEAAE